ncbi:hypothetical protein [Polynucleobacter sp. JS-JIR-5-A7]|uniref:hypothetical protein n=1 Tax=Polynucleobacter sp. JS-JIR-5-A7 TaxID=1758395 RepID=UPI001BFD31AD|nr:hypothetical protein [Polynucleobacter sp. JS-JIR-5-A7]QWE06923.1 hypothetical protein AOC29_01595 [Polynucleobacter sp. JS-JIR-5-A7]
MLPIFIIHQGSQSYLQRAIEFSRAHGNYTELIGTDHIIGSFCSEFHDSKKIISKEYLAFEKAYVHMSSNSQEFELLCFKRFFYLLQVVKSQKIKSFWMIDSDVMLLTNLSTFGQDVLIKNKYWAALSTPVQGDMDWASSPHVSFWTLEALSSFVTFLAGMYASLMIERLQTKYAYHMTTKIPGGICDMTALFLWQQENKGKIFNTARAHLDGYQLFDHNINMGGNYFPNEFIKNQLLDIKQISYANKTYFAKPVKSTALMPLSCLHFQGSSKKFIALFVKFKNVNLTSSCAYKILRWNDKKQFISNFFYWFDSIFTNLKNRINRSKKSLDTVIEAEIKGDNFYNNLYHLARDPQLKRFLEIGSSSGGGSTKAFVSSICQRSDKADVRFYCMELSKVRFDALHQTYKNDLFVKAYNLSSISSKEFPDRHEIIHFYNTVYTKLNNAKLSKVLKWHHNDIAYIQKSGSDINGIELIKSMENIQFFDMVLIDGSEFTGERELEYTIGAKIIALDDTETYKCFYAMQKLMLNENYRLLVHRPDVRNGYAIFCRKDFHLQVSIESINN